MDWCVRGGARDYVTTREVVWHIGAKDSEWVLVVPEGFEFESSVPRWLWWLLSPYNPLYLKSACVHDYLLEVKNAKPYFAASEWLDAAYSEGAGRGKAFAYSLGVLFYTMTVKHFRRRYD